MEELSDREFECFMSENVEGKWFCDFGINEKAPDFTTFCKFRNKLGLKKHASVDTQSSMINKVKVTKANVPDSDGLADVFHIVGRFWRTKGMFQQLK